MNTPAILFAISRTLDEHSLLVAPILGKSDLAEKIFNAVVTACAEARSDPFGGALSVGENLGVIPETLPETEALLLDDTFVREEEKLSS